MKFRTTLRAQGFDDARGAGNRAVVPSFPDVTRNIKEGLSEKVGLFFFVRSDHLPILVDRFTAGVVSGVMLDGLDAVSKVIVTLKYGQIMRAVVDDGRLIQRASAYPTVMFECRAMSLPLRLAPMAAQERL